MTINEYQNEAMRIASGMNQNYPIIVNGLMGLNGEAGEAIDTEKTFVSGARIRQGTSSQRTRRLCMVYSC